MTDFTSNFRDRYQHPNMVVSIDAELEFAAANIQSFFEDQIRNGTKFRAGETVQLGWMIVMLKADSEGNLEVWEPRFGTVPIIWERGVNKTYRQLIVQKTICEKADVEPIFPSLMQSGVVSLDFASARSFRMYRAEAEGNDSGWMFTGEGIVGEGGELKSLFEIASSRPEVIPFLALPAGATVVRTGEKIQIEFEGKVVDSDSNDFMGRLLKS
jgi:hypothetical protein